MLSASKNLFLCHSICICVLQVCTKLLFTVRYTNRQITASLFFAITKTMKKSPGNGIAESVKS